MVVVGLGSTVAAVSEGGALGRRWWWSFFWCGRGEGRRGAMGVGMRVGQGLGEAATPAPRIVHFPYNLAPV